SSRTMPGKDLENLKKDAQILTVRSNIASVTIVCFSKLIYAVVKVLKFVCCYQWRIEQREACLL
ncbi:hypothetical protein ACFLWZ_03745, partial [Chloroflexota bacterium]